MARRAKEPDYIEGNDLDLSPEGCERARIYHEEKSGHWVRTERVYKNEAQAQAACKRWIEAQPESFGAKNGEYFDAEVVVLVPEKWWQIPKLEKRYGVRVRINISPTNQSNEADINIVSDAPSGQW